jgi:hypothetical protein
MTTPESSGPFTGRDLALGAVVGAAVLAVYLRTLAPGLVAIIDTPVFQFVGRVLGVPHNPGYPAYVLLTHVYSWLPLGSLAWRMNLFSALMGAAAAAGGYVVSRELGARTFSSAAAALGLAFGRVFWSQAVIAEVYTLNAAIVTAVVASLLFWDRTRRPSWFYASVALLAIGLGNHTTIILLVPGMVVHALATDARFSLKPSSIAFITAMAIAAVGQYGFILLRSHTPGAYVESPARTIPELVDVIRGKQFSDALFAFGAADVLRVHTPRLIAGVLVPEFTVAGLLLAAIGVIRLSVARPARAALLGCGAALTFFFAINYDAIDIQVFLIPVFVLVWPFAALGIDAVVDRLPARGAPIAAALVAVAIATVQIGRNARMDDESHDREDAIYFARLFEGLPDRTVFVHEDFLVDRMVMYEALGAHAAGDRHVRPELLDRARVLAAVARGETVLAFPKGADRLRDLGIDVSYQPRRVTGEPYRLATHDLRPGWTATTGTAVTAGGRELLRTSDGVAIAILDGAGVVRSISVAEPDDEFRMPLAPPALSVYQVLGPGRSSPDLAQLLHRVDRHSDAIRMARDDQVRLIGGGWRPVEADAAGPFRRTSAAHAVMTLPLRRPASLLRLVAGAPRAGVRVTLRLDGRDLGAHSLSEGWNAYDWTVPTGAVGSGDHQVELVVDGGASIVVSSLTVTYAD